MHVDLSRLNADRLNKLCNSGLTTPSRFVNYHLDKVLSKLTHLNEEQIEKILTATLEKDSSSGSK